MSVLKDGISLIKKIEYFETPKDFKSFKEIFDHTVKYNPLFFLRDNNQIFKTKQYYDDRENDRENDNKIVDHPDNEWNDILFKIKDKECFKYAFDILTDKFNFDFQNYQEETLLHLCVKHSYIQGFKKCLPHIHMFETTIRLENTAFHYLHLSNLEFYKFLFSEEGPFFEFKPEPEIRTEFILKMIKRTNSMEQNIFWHICKEPNVEKVKVVFDFLKLHNVLDSFLMSLDKNKNTAFSTVMYNNNLETIKYILSEIPNKKLFSMKNKDNQTYIFNIYKCKNIEIVKYFFNLDFQNCQNIRDIHGNSILHYVMRNKNIKIVKFFLDNWNAEVETLLNNNGDTILHYLCAGNSNLETVEYVLNRYSHIIAEENKNQETILKSVEKNKPEIIKCVLNLFENNGNKYLSPFVSRLKGIYQESLENGYNIYGTKY